MSSAVRQLRRQQARTQLAARPKRVDEDENREERRRYQIPLSRRFESASRISRSPQARRLAETMEMPCAFCEFPMKYHPQPELYPCPVGVMDDGSGGLRGVFLPELSLPLSDRSGGSDQGNPLELAPGDGAVVESDGPADRQAFGPLDENRVHRSGVERAVGNGGISERSENDGAEQDAVLEGQTLQDGILPSELAQDYGLVPDGDQPDNSTPAWDGKLNWRPRVAIFVEPSPKKHQKRGRMAQRKALS